MAASKKEQLTATMVQELLQENLREAGMHDLEVVVKDESDGCGQSLVIIVVSDEFDGMKLLDRQRMVHKVLNSHSIMDKVHAVTLKTWTRQQRAKREATTS